MRRSTLALIVTGVLATAVAAPALSGGSDSTRAAVTVRMGEFFFRPKLVTVHVGQTVRFVNVGKIQHTVADTDRRWNIRSKLIKPRPLNHGAVQTVRFSHAGTVYYLCTFHPTLMRGRIVVVP